jgi:hypothetical protein
LDNVALKLAFQVQHVKGKTELFRHPARVVHVVQRTAARGQGLAVLVHTDPAPLVPQLHGKTDEFVALRL